MLEGTTCSLAGYLLCSWGTVVQPLRLPWEPVGSEGSTAGHRVQLPLQPCGQSRAEVSSCAGAGGSPGCSAFCSCAQRGWSLVLVGGWLLEGPCPEALGLLRGA